MLYSMQSILSMPNIFIDPKNLKTLATSAIEVYNRETNGFIAGKPVLMKIKGRERPVISLNTVYPLQTSDRKPSQVVNGNDLAHNRALSSLSAMNIPLIGGFHSHTDYSQDFDPYPELSHHDVDFIADEMKQINSHGGNIHRWLEVLMTVKKRDYSSVHKKGIKVKPFKRKLGLEVITAPYTSYKITLAGYWLQNGTQKLRVDGEAKIFVK